MPSRSIVLSQRAKFCPFSLQSNAPLCIRLLYSSVDGHLSCFCISAVVNNAVMNVGVFQSTDLFPSNKYVEWNGGIAGSYGSSILHFGGNDSDF